MNIFSKLGGSIYCSFLLFAVIISPAHAAAPFSESFDTYSLSSLYSQGLWQNNSHTWQVTDHGCYNNTGACISSTGLNGSNWKAGTDLAAGEWRIRFYVDHDFSRADLVPSIFFGSRDQTSQLNLSISTDAPGSTKITDNFGHTLGPSLINRQWHTLVYKWDMSDIHNCSFAVSIDGGTDIPTAPYLGTPADCYQNYFSEHVIGSMTLATYFVGPNQVMFDDIGDGPVVEGCLTNCLGNTKPQVTDTFDSFNSEGWTSPQTPGGGFTLFTYELGSSGNCHAGNCLVATDGATVHTNTPTMYLESGVGTDAGAFTVWGRARLGFRAANGNIAICTAKWSNCYASYEYRFNDAIAKDDTWHQYFIAWRQGTTTVEACILQDDTDAAHCVWKDTGFALGTQFDGVQLSASVARTDLGDQVWFDDLAEATTTPPACSKNCNSNVMFLPGIEASRLYSTNNKEVWLPPNDATADILKMDSNGNSINPDITTFDAIDHAGLGQLNHPVYQAFLNEMKGWESTYGITATTTPYDWRLDYSTLLANGRKLPNGHISYLQAPDTGHDPYLMEALKQLAATSKTGKVTIIAHSNGGLLAKALMIKLGDVETSKLIDKVIFVDVPQLGTPQAIGGLLHGYNQTISNLFSGGFSAGEARLVGANTSVAYNLLPSGQYFHSTDNPVITFDTNSLPDWIAKYTDPSNPAAGIHSTELLKNFMTDSSGFRTKPSFRDTATPDISNSQLFSNGTVAHISLDSWVAPASVQVFNIAGWGNETLASIQYMKEPNGCTIVVFKGCAVLTYSNQITYSPKTVIDGDGTVVESSELWANGATSTKYWVNLKDYNKFTNAIPILQIRNLLLTTHHNILEIPELDTLLSSIFKDGASAQLPVNYITTTRPVYDRSDPRLHFVLHSPLTLGFQDSNGNYTGSTAATSSFNVPGVDYERFGEVQWLSVPKSFAGQLVMHGTDSGSFALEIEDVNGNTILATTTFAAIPSATSTVVTLTINPGVSPTASSTLMVDYNGDGIIDSALQAKQGAVVLPDLTSPKTTLIVTGTQGKNRWFTSNVKVAFNATDTESGVFKTFFSLDGAATSTGTTTTITTEGIHLLSYYSTDIAGNIEASTSTLIKIDKTAPEAIISASTTLKDLVIIGMDNLSSTTVSATGSKTTITDQAGNSTTLAFQKTLNAGLLTLAKLVSIQYGTSIPVVLPTSFAFIWNPLISPPTLLSQTVVADSQFILQGLYDKQKNKTTIVVLKKNQQVQIISFSGLGIIKLTTNMGMVNYSW